MSPAESGSPGRFVIITGLSGSGKSTCLKALEDLGYYAVDNLPVELLSAFVQLPLKHMDDTFRGALCMDIRASHFVEEFPAVYSELSGQGIPMELVFLEASRDVLIRRFSQTRRQHPLSEDAGDLHRGIARERELLQPVRGMANQVLDTSRLTVHELKKEVWKLFSDRAAPAPLTLNVMSFGFKYGVPPEADMVIDVRFLPNPYFIEELRPLDGRDAAVVEYLRKEKVTWDFLGRFRGMLEFLLPLYMREGKSRLTVAVGCTGGRHRSVMISEWLYQNIKAPDCRVTLRHRDIHLDVS